MKSESKRIRRQCLEKLNREYEDSKLKQEFFMQQFKMYLKEECTYEELKRAAEIVKTEINNK